MTTFSLQTATLRTSNFPSDNFSLQTVSNWIAGKDEKQNNEPLTANWLYCRLLVSFKNCFHIFV